MSVMTGALLGRGAELLLEELRGLKPANVRCPGLLSGRGGVAYGLWRAGVARGDGDLLRAALRWTELAQIAQRGTRIWRPRPWSQFLGNTGYHFVRARVATTLGDRRLRASAVGEFVTSAARAIRRGSADLYEGMAGCLAAAAVLHREGDRRDRELAAVGVALGRSVLGELRRPTRRRSRYAGIAYGRGGLALALLEWSHASGRPLPVWFWARFHAMRRDPGPYFSARSWCNGPSGLIPAWVRAFELTGDSRFLATAQTSGRAALAAPVSTPTLCCGHPGAAYNFLALHRVDPGSDWRTRAEQSALAALAIEPDFRYRHRYGLTKGKTGILCLALDLLTEPNAGFPAIQA